MMATLRCDHCGEVIGVYEPLVMIVEGEAFETSRAATLGGRPLSGACFHRDCFDPERYDAPDAGG